VAQIPGWLTLTDTGMSVVHFTVCTVWLTARTLCQGTHESPRAIKGKRKAHVMWKHESFCLARHVQTAKNRTFAWDVDRTRDLFSYEGHALPPGPTGCTRCWKKRMRAVQRAPTRASRAPLGSKIWDSRGVVVQGRFETWALCAKEAALGSCLSVNQLGLLRKYLERDLQIDRSRQAKCWKLVECSSS